MYVRFGDILKLPVNIAPAPPPPPGCALAFVVLAPPAPPANNVNEPLNPGMYLGAALAVIVYVVFVIAANDAVIIDAVSYDITFIQTKLQPHGYQDSIRQPIKGTNKQLETQ